MLLDVREYIDRLKIDGHTIGDDHDDDPVLIDPAGRAVDTWRENYPYDERMTRESYDEEKYFLQVELLKFQKWAADSGSRHILIFEGRDAAGKGGTIKRITQYLSPRVVKIAALPAPTERETSQWYFQRYLAHLPSAGEIVLFDRSWYNRAGVEKVMGFCTPTEHRRFLHQCPLLERMLVEDGVLLRKYWFSVSDQEQQRRFKSRLKDPMRQWKLSTMDLESITRWEDFSRAKDEMMVHTDIPEAPWYVVEGDIKQSARLNMMAHLLASIPYREIPPATLKLPPRPKSKGYERSTREHVTYVPDHCSTLVSRKHDQRI